MRLPRLIAGCLLAGAVFAAPAGAQTFNVQILGVNGDGTANYAACGMAGSYQFALLPNGKAGQVWQVDVNLSTTPWTITNPKLLGTSCPGGSAGQTSGPGKTGAPIGGGGGGAGGAEESVDLAALLPKSAFNKVFSFRCDADGFGDGVVSVTINSIKGLGKSIKDDFNEAVDDQDGLVLVGKFVKVFKKGKKVKRSELDDADEVAVKGKLLKPSQWHEDEDGNPVPTIRSKRITITG